MKGEVHGLRDHLAGGGGEPEEEARDHSSALWWSSPPVAQALASASPSAGASGGGVMPATARSRTRMEGEVRSTLAGPRKRPPMRKIRAPGHYSVVQQTTHTAAEILRPPPSPPISARLGALPHPFWPTVEREDPPPTPTVRPSIATSTAALGDAGSRRHGTVGGSRQSCRRCCRRLPPIDDGVRCRGGPLLQRPSSMSRAGGCDAAHLQTDLNPFRLQCPPLWPSFAADGAHTLPRRPTSSPRRGTFRPSAGDCRATRGAAVGAQLGVSLEPAREYFSPFGGPHRGSTLFSPSASGPLLDSV